jgi:catechol 1,2-dioxygenase/hydroxyquinol 1,2-dioxygenase
MSYFTQLFCTAQSHPRLYEIYTSLIQHLHGFAREVKLTESELQQGRDFLNQASHHTQEIPTGEIHLLTDLLGISELVKLLDDAHHGTQSNLEGPLYVPNAPERQMGDRLGIDPEGDTLFLSGSVLDLNGQPIANALIDVWQPNSRYRCLKRNRCLYCQASGNRRCRRCGQLRIE